MKSKIVIIFFLVLVQALAQTDPQIGWIKLYPKITDKRLILADNTRDTSGNFYLACDVYNNLSSELKLIKYNNDGERLFEINELADSTFTLFGPKIAVDSEENIFLTGSKKHLTNPVTFSTFLTKYSANGKKLWCKEYFNVNYQSFVSLDKEQNPIVGFYQSPFLIIKKYLSNGDSLWSKSYASLSGLTKLFTSSANIYFTAYKLIPNTDPPDQVGFLYKLDDNGETIWSRDSTYGPICFDHNSNIICRTRGDIVYKLNSDGDIIWRNDSNIFAISAVTADNNDNVIVAGSSYDMTGKTANNYMTKKMSANGSLEWIKEFNSVDIDYSRDFIQDVVINSNNDIYVTGYSQRGMTYCYSIKYDKTGKEEYTIKMRDNDNTQFFGSNIYLNNDSFFIVGSTDSSVFLARIQEPITNSVSNKTDVSLDYSLSQNYPNPFNPSTTINYSVSAVGRNSISTNKVVLKVYDLLGREVATLVNEEKAAGNYQVKFDPAKSGQAGTNMPSGVYFYTLIADGFIKTKKMLLIK